MTTLSFDIFARDHASKEFDKLSKSVKGSARDVSAFGNQASASFEKAAGGLTSMVKSAQRAQGAEESITRAQRAALDAQVNLVSAREKAATQMRDLQAATRGAALTEEGAVLQLAKARQKLSEASKFGADGLDMRDAELGVQRAALAVDKAKESYARLSAESARATRAGVDGADQVVAAQRRLVDAQRGVQNAQRAASDEHSRNMRKNIKSVGEFGDRAAASFLKTANSLSNIPTAAAGLAGVGQIVADLSGVLGLLPAAAAAAGASFATLAVGTSGFVDGLKELGNSSKISKAASGVGDAAVQAARRIETAQQGLTRAIRSTKDAEDTLTRAQESARDAQVDLTRAREQATEQLEDLKRSVSGAALDEESAVLAVERAQERLNAAAREGGSALDFREAELGVRQAQQALEETRDRYADLRKEASAANKAGVEGSDEVVSAQRQVADAARGVTQAQQGVLDAAQNVAEAQREVADAFAAAAKSAAGAGSALSASTEKFDALGKNAQDTVRAILGLGGAWGDLKKSVQNELFAGISGEVKKLGAVYMPVLKEGMGGIAGEFNKGAKSLGSFLAEGRQADSIRTIFGGSRDMAGQFAQALKPLVSILLDVAAVGSEMLPGMTGGFGKAAEAAAGFVRNARETGALREWIQKGVDTLKRLGELFGNIGGIIGAVFGGLNLGGKDFLGTMIDVTGKVEAFLKSVEGQQALKALGTALATVSSVVTEVFLVALKEVAAIVVKLAPGFAELARQVGSVLVGALKIVGPILQGVAGFLSDNIDWLGPLALALYAGVKAFEAITAAVKIFNIVTALNPWVFIIAATIALALLIVTHWDQIKKFLADAWEWIKRTSAAVWEGIKHVIVDPIVSAAKWIGDLVGGIIDFFASIPRRIMEALRGLGDIIGNAFKGALNFAIKVLNWFVDRANDIIYGINVISPFGDIPFIPHVNYLAKGGPLGANQPAVVGEKGPELWVPNVSGTVIPNDKLGAYSAPAMDWAPPRIPSGTATQASSAPVDVRLVVGPSADTEVGNLVSLLIRRQVISLEANGAPVRVR